jgi:hypothetical protein
MSLIVALSILLSFSLLIKNLKERKGRTRFSSVTLGNEKKHEAQGAYARKKPVTTQGTQRIAQMRLSILGVNLALIE